MSDNTFGYALFTMQTGHRPLSAFSEIFEHLVNSMVSRLDEIESESGSTRRRNLEIALSDTAILMTYSLVEGFFFEEYKFYFNKEPKRGINLETTIGDLLVHIGLSNNELVQHGVAQIPSLRAARHAIAHRNGVLNETERAEIQNHFGTKVDTSRGYPVATTEFIVEMIRLAEKLISTYSEAALNSATQAQPVAQNGLPSAAP